MLKFLKVRRAAAKLTQACPDVTPDDARDRARRLLTAYPALPSNVAADELVRGERVSRAFLEWVGLLR